MAKRQLSGKIISDKMHKTVVVNVERVKEHPKYRRRYRISQNYKAHVEGESYNEHDAQYTGRRTARYKIGDKVLIEECRPISKDKKWKVVKKINSETP